MTDNTTHTNGTEPDAEHDHPSFDEVADKIKGGLAQVLGMVFPDSDVKIEELRPEDMPDLAVPHELPCGCIGVRVERNEPTPNGRVGIDVTMHFDKGADLRSVGAELFMAYSEAMIKLQHMIIAESNPDTPDDDQPFEAPPEGVDVTEGAEDAHGA